MWLTGLGCCPSCNRSSSRTRRAAGHRVHRAASPRCRSRARYCFRSRASAVSLGTSERATDGRQHSSRIVCCRRSTCPFVCGLPARMRRCSTPSCPSASTKLPARNSEPLSVTTASKLRPAIASSEATRRTSAEQCSLRGLRGERSAAPPRRSSRRRRSPCTARPHPSCPPAVPRRSSRGRPARRAVMPRHAARALGRRAFARSGQRSRRPAKNAACAY